MLQQYRKIPPGILTKLDRLSLEEKRIYIQERIGNYEHMMNRLADRARRREEEWIARQAEWMQEVIAELRAVQANLT